MLMLATHGWYPRDLCMLAQFLLQGPVAADNTGRLLEKLLYGGREDFLSPTLSPRFIPSRVKNALWES